jgi:hypothetical protein
LAPPPPPPWQGLLEPVRSCFKCFKQLPRLPWQDMVICTPRKTELLGVLAQALRDTQQPLNMNFETQFRLDLGGRKKTGQKKKKQTSHSASKASLFANLFFLLLLFFLCP